MHTRAATSSSAVVTQQSARHALLLLLVLSVNARKAVVGAYDAVAALTSKRTLPSFLVNPWALPVCLSFVVTDNFVCARLCNSDEQAEDRDPRAGLFVQRCVSLAVASVVLSS